MATALQVHPFEKAGLGVAPFRFSGMSEKVYVACPGAPEQPAGTCDYCGMGIRYCCHIESADGKSFVVGSDCVRKTDRDALLNASDYDKAIADHKAKVARERTNKCRAATQNRINAAWERIKSDPVVSAHFASHPHPVASMAEGGKTLRDYADYMRRYAGHSGCMKIVRIVEGL